MISLFLALLIVAACAALSVSVCLPLLIPLLDAAKSVLPVLNLVAGILLAVNLALFVLLLVLFLKWNHSRWQDPAYLAQLPHWKRSVLLLIKYLFLLGAVWEGIVAALCVLYLLIQPVSLLPSVLP